MVKNNGKIQNTKSGKNMTEMDTARQKKDEQGEDIITEEMNVNNQKRTENSVDNSKNNKRYFEIQTIG